MAVKDGSNNTDGAVTSAVDELYLDAPEGFVARRSELAKAARTAGDRVGATAIGALGRPTRAAWVVNRLVRTEPDVVTALLELGAELRAAQEELSADSLRELSDRRRKLVRDVTRQAFTLADIDRPPTGLVDEVQNTLNAAVIDADVGAAVQGATLLRAAQASGFGPAGPALAVVPSTTSGATPPKPPKTASPKSSRSTQPSAVEKSRSSQATTPAARNPTPVPAAKPSAHEAREAREQEQRRQREERRAAGQQAIAAARETLDAARAQESERRDRVRVLTEQVRAAERELGDAGLAVREAHAALRAAEREQRRR